MYQFLKRLDHTYSTFISTGSGKQKPAATSSVAVAADVGVSEADEEKLIWLRSNTEPATTVAAYMSETYACRKTMIESSQWSIGDILDKFPRILSPGMVCLS